jgi:hypothetical protein
MWQPFLHWISANVALRARAARAWGLPVANFVPVFGICSIGYHARPRLRPADCIVRQKRALLSVGDVKFVEPGLKCIHRVVTYQLVVVWVVRVVWPPHLKY